MELVFPALIAAIGGDLDQIALRQRDFARLIDREMLRLRLPRHQLRRRHPLTRSIRPGVADKLEHFAALAAVGHIAAFGFHHWRRFAF
jgi:hypothetical protein